MLREPLAPLVFVAGFILTVGSALRLILLLPCLSKCVMRYPRSPGSSPFERDVGVICNPVARRAKAADERFDQRKRCDAWCLWLRTLIQLQSTRSPSPLAPHLRSQIQPILTEQRIQLNNLHTQLGATKRRVWSGRRVVGPRWISSLTCRNRHTSRGSTLPFPMHRP